MTTVYVDLSTTKHVKDFVSALTKVEGDFELVSGTYKLDGRSIMGIFSLDRSKPIRLDIYNDSEASINTLKPFITENWEAL